MQKLTPTYSNMSKEIAVKICLNILATVFQVKYDDLIKSQILSVTFSCVV